TGNVLAQNNPKFFEDTCYWHVYREYPQPTGMYQSNDYFKVQGDTIYNGKLYQKIYRKGYTNTPVQPINAAAFTFYGYCLEDSNKVYFGTNFNNQALQYDFNLAAGDSFLFATYDVTINYFVYRYIKVNYVDSVLYGGTWRNRIVFNEIHGAQFPEHIIIEWVRGIGDPNYGPWISPAHVQALKRYGDIELICFTENFNQVIGVCNFIGLEDHINDQENEFTLNPNPCSDKLSITVNTSESLYLQLLDINGKLVLEQAFKNTTQLDIANLPKGMYMVRIKGSTINLAKRVVLVE
ncbi:MAG TPA: T9SS type A sorting domain-containing protein, partial [Bacteroidia bacterium]